MITIRISGPAAEGKTRAAQVLKTLLEAEGYGQVVLIDEITRFKMPYVSELLSPRTTPTRLAKAEKFLCGGEGAAVASVLILVGENVP